MDRISSLENLQSDKNGIVCKLLLFYNFITSIGVFKNCSTPLVFWTLACIW